MTIEEMNQRKKELGYTYKQISELSGVPVSTVQKVLGGIVKAPRYETLQALQGVLKKRSYTLPEGSTPAAGILQENSYVYGSTAPADSTPSEDRDSYPLLPGKKQGEYTYEDYLSLPDDIRVELIDGVIYDMSAPRLIHQSILLALHEQFLPCINAHPECAFFISPVDVRLDEDDKTVVQPDILITCSREKLEGRYIWGSPDFVIEVLSPSTRKKDMFIKSNKYMNAGVKEYWMIDTTAKKIFVYRFEEDDNLKLYTFDDTVPVGISEGSCSIDFKKVYERISFYYE